MSCRLEDPVAETNLASKGNTEPFVMASYAVQHCHSDDVWPRIVANRKAKLGREYELWFDAAGNLKPDGIPKKPATRADARKLLRILPAEPPAPLRFSLRAPVERAKSWWRGPSMNSVRARIAHLLRSTAPPFPKP